MRNAVQAVAPIGTLDPVEISHLRCKGAGPMSRAPNSRFTERDSRTMTTDRTGPEDTSPATSPHAELYRRERRAALRALAGRLAHDLRNPLAAVRAACSGLEEDIDDEDHKHRLNLCLKEIDRALALVTGTVTSVLEPPEGAVPVTIGEAVDAAVQALAPFRPQVLTVPVSIPADASCLLPATGMQAAVYDLLDYLLDEHRADQVAIELKQQEGRILVQFLAPPMPPNEEAMQTKQSFNTTTGQGTAVNLLVADRFARDCGGRLSCAVLDDGRHSITLDLPCGHG